MGVEDENLPEIIDGAHAETLDDLVVKLVDAGNLLFEAGGVDGLTRGNGVVQVGPLVIKGPTRNLHSVDEDCDTCANPACPHAGHSVVTLADCANDYRRFFANMRDSISEISTDGETFAVGNATLFCPNKGGYPLFWDSFTPVSMLAEEILKEGERIEELSHIRFDIGLENNIKIAVFEEGKANPFSNDSCEESFHGRLHTSAGRILCFSVVQGDEPLKEVDQVGFSISETSFKTIKVGNDACVIGITGNVPMEMSDFGRDNNIFIQRFMCELLSRGVMEILQETDADDQGDVFFTHFKFGEIEELQFPESLDGILFEGSELQLNFLRSESKHGRSGRLIQPFIYRFSSQNEWSRMVIAIKRYTSEEEVKRDLGI